MNHLRSAYNIGRRLLFVNGFWLGNKVARCWLLRHAQNAGASQSQSAATEQRDRADS